jgi:hypothetical protein
MSGMRGAESLQGGVVKDPVQKLAVSILGALFNILDPNAPLSPGLDPDHRTGPPEVYGRKGPIPEGACPRCGAADSRSALQWEPHARCRECVRRLEAS